MTDSYDGAVSICSVSKGSGDHARLSAVQGAHMTNRGPPGPGSEHRQEMTKGEALMFGFVLCIDRGRQL